MIGANMVRPKKQVRADLNIANEYAKEFFYLLREQRQAIEAELGYELAWEELPSGRDTRISITMNNVDPENRSDWPRQHEWLAQRVNDLHRVFGNRVRPLRHEDWHGEAEPLG
jgi:hypothetical protein